jgi:SAM-dependent methyltransferase
VTTRPTKEPTLSAIGDTTALSKIRPLLTDAPTHVEAGYLDVLGPVVEPGPTPAQRAMRSTLLPQIYERLWRPLGFNVAKGWPIGPGTGAEQALARDRLGLARPTAIRKPAVTVLDVACGPGNVTRALAEGVAPEGLVVGLDTSPTMLARAVDDTSADSVGYVRADAESLPFHDATFDAVCCLGGLYLFARPWVAIDEMARVLRPGGRLAVLTTRRPVLPPVGRATGIAGHLSGIALFDDAALVRAFTERGLTSIRHHRYPLMQFTSARRPGRRPEAPPVPGSG